MYLMYFDQTLRSRLVNKELKSAATQSFSYIFQAEGNLAFLAICYKRNVV